MNDVERANAVLERLLADPRRGPKIQQIIADAQMFDELRTNVGWRRLFDIVAAQKERWMRKLANRLMRGDVPSPAEIAYYRGYYEGAYFVLVHPEVAEGNLEKAAAMAWRLYGDTLESTEEVE